MKKLTKEQMEIVKQEHPEWFNRIEVGKWYFKQYHRQSSIIFFCQGHRSGYAYGYGINTSSNGKTEWFSDSNVVESNNDGFREATTEEVEQALIAEAKKRYKVGDRISKVDEDSAKCENRCFGCREFSLEGVRLYMRNDISEYYYCIFYDGQWASVISEEKPSLQDDIQALKDRWPDINFTIIAEEKK